MGMKQPAAGVYVVGSGSRFAVADAGIDGYCAAATRDCTTGDGYQCCTLRLQQLVFVGVGGLEGVAE